MAQPVIHFRGNERFPHGSPTLREFVLDDEYDVNLIQGPVESGKTGAAMAKVYKAMCEIPRCRDGIRRSRWLFVRPTYGELQTTIVRDFRAWFPPEVYGNFKETEPYEYKMKFLDVEATIDFVAYADIDEKTLRKLRSSAYTGAWVNEGQYCPLELFVEIVSRTGRYPHKDGPGKDVCPDYDRRKWAILDNNAPPRYDHWILYMRGDIPIPPDTPEDQRVAYRKPENWKFWRQPAAVLDVLDSEGKLIGYELNPVAENLQNMGDNPYLGAMGGMRRDQIQRDYQNKTVATKGGFPRYPMFNRDKHVAKEPLKAYEGAPLELGHDFGLTGAVIVGQFIDNRLYILHEWAAENEGPEELAPRVKVELFKKFPFARDAGVISWGDPQGGWRGTLSASKKKTSFKIWENHGFTIRNPFGSGKKDDPQLRMETGRKTFNNFPGGEPYILISPTCTRLIAALEACKMRTIKISGKEEVQEVIVKDDASHPVEALEYLFIGRGEGAALIKTPKDRKRSKPKNMIGGADTDVWGRKKGSRKRAVA